MKHYVLRALQKLGILRFLNFKTSVFVNRKRIVIPVNAGMGLGNIEISEKWMMEILDTLSLPQDEVVVDVGVNIGQTLIKLRAISSNIEYIGFEPNPKCVNYVAELVDANNWINISIVPAGIAEKSGVVMLQFYSDDAMDSCASIVSGFRDKSTVKRKTFCACCSASDLNGVFHGKKISLVKIDVEGAELEVINGLKKIIEEHKSYLLVEILPVYNDDNHNRLERQRMIENIMDEMSYLKYRIHKNKEDSLHSLEQIESIGIHDRLDWCDYLFSPNAIEVIKN